jgi:hypothetical protein
MTNIDCRALRASSHSNVEDSKEAVDRRDRNEKPRSRVKRQWSQTTLASKMAATVMYPASQPKSHKLSKTERAPAPAPLPLLTKVVRVNVPRVTASVTITAMSAELSLRYMRLLAENTQSVHANCAPASVGAM